MSTARAAKPIWEAVAALFEPLVVASVGNVSTFETPAPGQAFPYITFALDFPEHGPAAGQGGLQVDVWDNGPVERILAIQDAVAALFDANPVLTFAGGTANVQAASTPPIGRDPDGTTRHGVQIFRVLVHT